MSVSVLPSLINYDEQLKSLLAGTQNYTQVVQPTNSRSTYTQNEQIIFDLPSRGFIDPKSIYIRYKNTTTVSTGNASIIGCPVYTPILRLDTYVNSQLVDSVSDYNLIAHTWSNLYLGVNEKYGAQYGFGYRDLTPSTVTLDELDGHYSSAGESFFVSAPLVCNMITGCEKMWPSFIAPVRFVLTLDQNVNVFNNDSPSATYSISNVELVFDMVDFGSEVEQQIMMRDNVTIKSNSYNGSGVNCAVGSSGTQTFVFNQRFASIRNALVLPCGAMGANYTNGKFDAVDVSNGGSYQLNVAGQVFPQGGPISFANNKAGAISELRKATGNLYDWSKSMSINTTEFSYTPNPTTTLTQPAKCYVAFDMNKINSSSNMMLNGTSSQNSPINLIINFASALTTTAINLELVLNYDCIITLDPRTKQVTVLQ